MGERIPSNLNAQKLNVDSSSNTPVFENSAPSVNLSRFVTNSFSGVPTGLHELSISETSL